MVHRLNRIVPQVLITDLVPPTATPQALETKSARTWHCPGGSTPSRTAQRSARRPGPRRPAARSQAAAAGAPPSCGAPGPSWALAPPTPPRIPLASRIAANTPHRDTVSNPRAGSHRGEAGQTPARSGGRRGRTGEVARVWSRVGICLAAASLPFTVASSLAIFLFRFLPLWYRIGFGGFGDEDGKLETAADWGMGVEEETWGKGEISIFNLGSHASQSV